MSSLVFGGDSASIAATAIGLANVARKNFVLVAAIAAAQPVAFTEVAKNGAHAEALAGEILDVVMHGALS